MNELERIGGWLMHHKAKFKPTTKIKSDCEVCRCKYIVTNKKNHKTEEALIYLDANEIKEHFWNNASDMEIEQEKVTVHYAICPVCNHKEELFCEPIEKITTTEIWGRHGL